MIYLNRSTGPLKCPNGFDDGPLKYIGVLDVSMSCNYISTNTLICKVQTLLFNINMGRFSFIFKKCGCDKLFSNNQIINIAFFHKKQIYFVCIYVCSINNFCSGYLLISQEIDLQQPMTTLVLHLHFFMHSCKYGRNYSFLRENISKEKK